MKETTKIAELKCSCTGVF